MGSAALVLVLGPAAPVLVLGPAALVLGPAALVLGPAAPVLACAMLGTATLVILNGITSHYFMKSISIL